MARNTAPEDEPTSNWNHSHCVQEDDVLCHVETGEEWEVTTVGDHGNVRVRRIDEGRAGPNDRDTWSENSVRVALAHEEMERKRDGKSHELATW